jgi:hypothetical protein
MWTDSHIVSVMPSFCTMNAKKTGLSAISFVFSLQGSGSDDSSSDSGSDSNDSSDSSDSGDNNENNDSGESSSSESDSD